ncbi:MAG: hypothetical protein JNM10_19330 [Planctomycetia bacterium]|nr:hypothetical protein [Planctomycetia bacterium]
MERRPTLVRRLAIVGAVLVAGAAARAAPDPVATFRAEVRRLQAEERAYGEAFPARQREALDRRQAILRQHSDANVSPIPDDANAPVAALARPLAAIEARRGEAALALARSGAPAAGPVLLDDAFATVAAAEALDAEILAARPTVFGTIHDQAPAFRRSALATREAAAIAALAAVPGAAAFLAGDAWAEAVEKDGKRSVARRVLVVDVLGRVAARESVAFLTSVGQSPLVCLRQAAIEAAARCGAAGEEALRAGLSDPHVLVRRATLAALRASAPTTGRMLRSLVARLAEARGAERRETVEALRALSGQAFADDPAAWGGWLATRQAGIDAGTFDARREVPAGSATTAAVAATVPFYGLRLAADGVVFVIDWTLPMVYPADLAFARTGKPIDWFGADASWVGRQGQERQQTVVRRELARTLTAMGPHGRFGVVALRDGSRDAWPKIQEDAVLGRRALLACDARSIARLDGVFDATPPGWSRWHESLDGLWIAADLAHLGPGPLVELGTPVADTLVFVSDGRHRGGRYLLVEEEVAAFVRWNRFRRLVVHTVRIADAGTAAAALLEGYARGSGGTSDWSVRAPPR